VRYGYRIPAPVATGAVATVAAGCVT